MNHINKQQQADLAVDACNICVFTVNLSTNSLIHHFRYNWGYLKPVFQTAFYRPKKENPIKPMTASMAAAVFSVLSLSVCGGSEKGMSIQEQTEARFQLDPHPKQAYRLRIKIDGAPGPLKLMGKFGVGYKTENCTYIINQIEGTPARPEKNLQTGIRQLGEFEYGAVVYADALSDEDYFGEGVYHWQPEGFDFSLKATGGAEETGFNFSEIMKYLLDRETLTEYYWKGGYPYSKDTHRSSSNIGNIVSFGGGALTDFSADGQQDLFAITVTLEELQLWVILLDSSRLILHQTPAVPVPLPLTCRQIHLYITSAIIEAI